MSFLTGLLGLIDIKDVISVAKKGIFGKKKNTKGFKLSAALPKGLKASVPSSAAVVALFEAYNLPQIVEVAGTPIPLALLLGIIVQITSMVQSFYKYKTPK